MWGGGEGWRGITHIALVKGKEGRSVCKGQRRSKVSEYTTAIKGKSNRQCSKEEAHLTVGGEIIIKNMKWTKRMKEINERWHYVLEHSN